MKQWINSPGHNANMLATELTHSADSVYVVAWDNKLWYYGSQLNVSEDSPDELFKKILKWTSSEEKKVSENSDVSRILFG